MSMKNNIYELPLAGVKVLDLTRVRAGPTAARQLVDWGADVIKIEAPEIIDRGTDMGGPRDGSDFQNLNVGKRSLTLDLKSPKGLSIFYQLVRTADIVIENFRPDVKDRLSIDYTTLAKINPRIIYASISGYGQDGPYYKRPGFDQIIQGMSGLMSITGHPNTVPVRVGIAVADSVTGQMCSQGILLALLERARSGVGQWVQVSLLETMINLLDFQAVRWLNEGEIPDQTGNDHGTRMPTSVYRTMDGYITICAAADNMWQKLCECIGRPDFLINPAFRNQEARSLNRRSLNIEIECQLTAKPSEYWIEKLNSVGVACGEVNSIDKMFEDPQVRHINPIRLVEHQRLGSIKVLAQPIHLSRSPDKIKTAAPDRGANTNEILMELNMSQDEIRELKDELVI